MSLRFSYESTPFLEPFKKEKFISIFSEYINKYIHCDRSGKELINSCIGENSRRIGENAVSHFPIRVYIVLEDLEETNTNPANCPSSTLTASVKDNSDFVTPEPVSFYTDIIKSNLVRDSYVILSTTLHFPSTTGYHRFNYPRCRPIGLKFIVHNHSSNYKQR